MTPVLTIPHRNLEEVMVRRPANYGAFRDRASLRSASAIRREYGSKRSSLGPSREERGACETGAARPPGLCINTDTTLDERTPRSTRTPERTDSSSTSASKSDAGLSLVAPKAEKSNERASMRATQSTVAKCRSAAAKASKLLDDSDSRNTCMSLVLGTTARKVELLGVTERPGTWP